MNIAFLSWTIGQVRDSDCSLDLCTAVVPCLSFRSPGDSFLGVPSELYLGASSWIGRERAVYSSKRAATNCLLEESTWTRTTLAVTVWRWPKRLLEAILMVR